MGEVVEEHPVLVEQPVQQPLVVGAHSAEGDQQLGGSAHHGNGVDLDAAQRARHLQQALGGGRRAQSGQALGAHGEPARRLEGKLHKAVSESARGSGGDSSPRPATAPAAGSAAGG